MSLKLGLDFIQYMRWDNLILNFRTNWECKTPAKKGKLVLPNPMLVFVSWGQAVTQLWGLTDASFSLGLFIISHLWWYEGWDFGVADVYFGDGFLMRFDFHLSNVKSDLSWQFIGVHVQQSSKYLLYTQKKTEPISSFLVTNRANRVKFAFLYLKYDSALSPRDSARKSNRSSL